MWLVDLCKSICSSLCEGVISLVQKLASRDINTEVGGQQIDAKDNAKISVSNTQNTGPVVNINERSTTDRGKLGNDEEVGSVPMGERPSANRDNATQNVIAGSGNIIQINIDNVDRLLDSEKKEHKENLEDILSAAAQMLPPEAGQTSNHSPGWDLNFTKHAKTVSEPELKELWAKLLAGEIQSPQSISKKTMSLISDLEVNDAQLFQDSTKFVFDNIISHQSDPDNKYSWKPSIERIKGFPSYGVITHLATLGLLAPLIGRRTYSAPISDKFEVVSEWLAHGYEYELQVNNWTAEELNINLPGYALTRSGLELHNVIGEEINPQYLKMVSRNIYYLLENKGEHRIMRRKLASNTSENQIDSNEEWEQISYKP